MCLSDPTDINIKIEHQTAMFYADPHHKKINIDGCFYPVLGYTLFLVLGIAKRV